jgi:hypothetical protein
MQWKTHVIMLNRSEGPAPTMTVSRRWRTPRHDPEEFVSLWQQELFGITTSGQIN